MMTPEEKALLLKTRGALSNSMSLVNELSAELRRSRNSMEHTAQAIARDPAYAEGPDLEAALLEVLGDVESTISDRAGRVAMEVLDRVGDARCRLGTCGHPPEPCAALQGEEG